MYAGRGDDEDIVSLHRELAGRTPDKADAIRTIVSKVPLAEYLARGLVLAQQELFDLDGRW